MGQYRHRKIVSSGRYVNTCEETDGFYVVSSCGDRLHGVFGLNDPRFSTPFDLNDSGKNQKSIQELIEEERQKAYLEGINRGLSVASTIMNRHFANHTLVKPHTPEELLAFDKEEIFLHLTGIQTWVC